jgi:nitrite reductase (NO-forming)
MSVPPATKLSEIIDERTDRRAFLGRASTLGLALPAVAALTGCTKTEQVPPTDTSAGSRAAADSGSPTASSGQAPATGALQNANSRLDTAHPVGAHERSTAQGATSGVPVAPFKRYDPALPPLSSARTLQLNWSAMELPLHITKDTVVAAWTFEGDIPGPVVHCRVGDTIEFTLTNRGKIPHSMDFHAAQIDPKHAFRSAMPGESVSFTFKPRHAGAFMYHCGTAPVLMHIGTGMYGAIIVDPPTPLPKAKEFVLVQSEFYLAAAQGGIQAFDYNKMLATMPDYVAFNGRPSQYVADPIKVKIGDRVRFYVVDAGPTHPCNFHVVGEQFDTVYLGAPPATPLRGVQTFTVAPGGGMIFELVCDMPGEFPFVNHGFGHGQKGAIGFLIVEA